MADPDPTRLLLWEVPPTIKKEVTIVLRALVLHPGNTSDLNSLLHIAGCEAKKREHVHKRVEIKALRYFPELKVYVAVYEKPKGAQRSGVRQGKVRP